MNQFHRAVACFSLLAMLGHTASLGVSAQPVDVSTTNISKHTNTAIADITNKNEYSPTLPCTDDISSDPYHWGDSYLHRVYLSAVTAKKPELGYGTIRTDATELRSGPGMAYKAVIQASEGDSAYIISFHNQWFKVIYKDQICYVSGNDLQLKVFPYDVRIAAQTASISTEQEQLAAHQNKDLRSKNAEPKAKRNKKASAGNGVLSESKDTPSKKPETLSENKEVSLETKDPLPENKETLPESAAPETASSIIADAKNFIGTPYAWGGTGPKGFDCSGFIQYVYSKNGIKLPRTTTDQYQRGESVKKSNLQPGDLVFLANTYRDGISHVGIYIGDGNVIHASSSKGVTVTSLSGSFFSEHYHGSRRIIE